MKDQDKTREQLINELGEMRHRIAQLEASGIGCRQAEEALAHERDLLYALMDNVPDTIYFKDTASCFTRINKAQAQVLGVNEPGEAIGKTDSDFFTAEHARDAYADEQKIVQSGHPLIYKVEKIRRADGEFRWVSTTKVPVVDRAGRVTGTVGISRDITERKRAEEALQRRLVQLTGLNRASQVVTASLELDQVLAEIVSLAREVVASEYASVSLVDEEGRLGQSSEYLPGVPEIRGRIRAEGFANWIIRSRQAVVVDDIDEDGTVQPRPADGAPCAANTHVIEAGVKSFVGLPLVAKDRLLGVLFLHSLRPGTFHGQLPLLTTFANQAAVAIENARLFGQAQREIAERKRAEEALAAEKERLAVTLRSIGDGVITTGVEGQIVLINRVAETLTGWTEDEALGKPLGEVFHIINEKTRQRCENPVEKVLESEGIAGLANHTVLVARDGSERILADSGAPIRDRDSKIIGVVLVFHDITEKRKMEKELLKADKLESVGILAGGIAHDFNNILMAILGNISFARMKVNPEDELFETLSAAEKASLRAKDLTRQLLTFAKGGAPVKKTASIAALIKDSADFALRGSNVRCEFSIPDDLWPVEVDEGQISQVINNLIINADQAMPKGGVIKVRAENMTIGAEHVLPLKDGKYVKISVEDQGIGVPEEHLPKIFDPYFTTKQKGSGLGLATSFSIVNNHEGHIAVESELGVGTTFYVYLPASHKEIPTKKKEQAEERPLVRKGKILVMDDEEMARDATGRMLKYVGYEVTFAQDGAEAIELYKKAHESGQPFDAVIMDLTVPGGIGGKEAIKKLLEINPEVKAIVSSGYSTDPIMSEFKQYGFSGVVAKPYDIAKLSETVDKLIYGNE